MSVQSGRLDFGHVHFPNSTLSSLMVKLTPFEIGQLKAHSYHGLGQTAIARIVHKGDGFTISVEAMADVLAKLTDDPAWRGVRVYGWVDKRNGRQPA